MFECSAEEFAWRNALLPVVVCLLMALLTLIQRGHIVVD